MRHAVQIGKLFFIGPALGILGTVVLVALAVGVAANAALLAVFTASFHLFNPHSLVARPGVDPGGMGCLGHAGAAHAP